MNEEYAAYCAKLQAARRRSCTCLPGLCTHRCATCWLPDGAFLAECPRWQHAPPTVDRKAPAPSARSPRRLRLRSVGLDMVRPQRLGTSKGHNGTTHHTDAASPSGRKMDPHKLVPNLDHPFPRPGRLNITIPAAMRQPGPRQRRTQP